MYRFGGPLFFANADTFRNAVLLLADTDPRPKWILLVADAMTDIDITAADMLADLDGTLNATDISLVSPN